MPTLTCQLGEKHPTIPGYYLLRMYPSGTLLYGTKNHRKFQENINMSHLFIRIDKRTRDTRAVNFQDIERVLYNEYDEPKRDEVRAYFNRGGMIADGLAYYARMPKPETRTYETVPPENQISELCDLLLAQVPSPCARELIFQIRSLAGNARHTRSGSLQSGSRQPEAV